MVFDFEDDPGNNENNDEDDDEEEPDRTKDDELRNLGNRPFIVDSVSDIEKTDGRGVRPRDFVRKGAIWENDAGLWRIIIRKNDIIREGWCDFEGVIGGAVSVASVFDGGANFKVAVKDEAWN